MRYFTQELLDRFRSADDDVADAADAEWEKASEAYRAAVDAMALPPDVLSLARDYCFHDDYVRAMSRFSRDGSPNSVGMLIVKLEQRGLRREIVYANAHYVEPVSLVGTHWLYDEVEALRHAPSPGARGESDWYLHRILTDRGEVTIRFKSVTVTTA